MRQLLKLQVIYWGSTHAQHRVLEAEVSRQIHQKSVASLKMPSAITKQPLDNGASLPQETSIQAAIAIVEKKVRNLEKRKVGHHLTSRTARGDAGITLVLKIYSQFFRESSTPTETF